MSIMACANINSPEFKKLTNLTKLDPSDVSMAVGMWQEHYQTDAWPSSSQVLSMIRNRQTFGGIDKYLSSISKPVLKSDIEAAAKNLPERVKSIADSLKSIIPGIGFVIHETRESYEQAIKDANGGVLRNATSNAFYSVTDKKSEIHLNVPRMLEVMSRDKKAKLNAVEHEATHPILEAIETITPGTIASLYRDLVKIEKEFGLDGKYTRKFASYYDLKMGPEEAVVEFIADIASGNLDLSKAPKSLLEKISEFIAKIFKSLNINIKPYLRTDKEIVRFANQIKGLFDGKIKKSDIIKRQESQTDATSRSVKTPTIKFQIIGEAGAKNLDQAEERYYRINNLGVAKKMEKAGSTVDEIKYATGWERGGNNGKWRYEIPDIRARKAVGVATFRNAIMAQEIINDLNKNNDFETDRSLHIFYIDKLYEELGVNKFDRDAARAVSKALAEKNKDYLPPNSIKGNIKFFTNVRGEGYALLRDVIEHEELFKAYPDFKDIKVRLYDFKDDAGWMTYASWDPVNREIKVSDKLPEDDARSSLIHEIQHAIQESEGFERGASMKMFSNARDNIKSIFTEITAAFDKLGYEDWLKNGGVVDNQPDRYFNGMYSFAKKQPKSIRDKMILKLDEANKIIKENNRVFGGNNMYGIRDGELYEKMAGEVEARNAQSRRFLSDEDRQKIPLRFTEDVSRDSQIFVGDESSSIFPASKDVSKNLIIGTDKAKRMTTLDDSFVFYSYNNEFTDKMHTEPLPFMTNAGNVQYSASVRYDEVYPLEEDPNGYVTGQIVGEQLDSVKEKAKRDGFKVVLTNGSNSLVVAHPVVPLKLEQDSVKPKETKNISLSALISRGEKITSKNTYSELSSNKYLLRNGVVRRILSVKKINDLFHKYFWANVNSPSVIYETTVGGKKETTELVKNKIKWSLSETDNSESKKSPYEESVAFGRLVTDIAVHLKEGFLDINQVRELAGVDADTYEVFGDAYDLAVIRSGLPPSNARQFALYDLIKQLPKGEGRPTAQELYRKRNELLDSLRITPVMLKQILPDADIYKDKRINQTWKRILFVIDDVGDYVSKTLDKGRKFQITDTEGNASGYWDETALGFSDMIAYVNAAVEADPENKERLLENVRQALKKSGDDEMLQLLEVAIAAAGKTNMSDLSKVVRAGSLAGRVLNVIKRYIGSAQFGTVRTDLAAATVIAENDEILNTILVDEDSDDSPTALELIEEIETILKISQMSEDERNDFFNENPDLVANVEKFLEGIDLKRRATTKADKKRIQRGNSKIAKGIVSLTDVLQKKYPELIKMSRSEIDPDVLKAVKQIIRGLIDIHGTDTITLKTELGIIFTEENIILDADTILNDPGVREYINNHDRHNIRNGAIEALGASDDTYTKMVIDRVLRAINAPPSKASITDQLIDALDRGELTKKALDAVRDQIDLIEDEERKKELLDRLNKKFVTIFESAVPAKIFGDAVSQGMGRVTKNIVDAYIADPEKSKEVLAAQAIQNLGMTPDQAVEWSNKIAQRVEEKLEKAKKKKIKSLLNTKIPNSKKAEQIEEKVFKIISATANPDGTIPSETDVDGKMIDIKQVFADKYNVRLNDPRAIAKIVALANLMKVARTQARREQIYAQIMLAIKNMKLSPNKYVRGLKMGIMELPTFVMANILDGVNTAYKATLAGLYNSLRAFIEGSIVGKSIDIYYGGKKITPEVFDELKKSNSKSPASHLMLTYRLFWDVMRNGSASISQTNIPEHGLSNFDMTLNNHLALRVLYAPFRWLSAIDRATMNLNHNRLARRRAVNMLLEFGKNNVNLDGQNYSRTAGGAGWYKVDQNNQPEIDPATGNIKTIRDPNEIQRLNDAAKSNFTTTEFVLEAERLLGLNNINEIYKGVVDEWNALVDLALSPTASPEEKEELKRLGIDGRATKRVSTIDDFASMDGRVRRFVAQEIYKKIHDQQNEALDRAVGIESGMYSAQGIIIPGWPAGILYQTATMLDNAIMSGVNSKNAITRILTYSFAVPAKLYSFLITKAPSIGYGAALFYSPVSFLMNLGNLMAYVAGRPFMRISFDAKEKAWRFNGLTTKEIRAATGISNLTPKDLMWSTNDRVLRVLKEGYTVVSEGNNSFSMKPSRIMTIGGQGGNAEIATILARQAMATASFALLVSLMYDCPDDDCELSPFGKKLLSILKLEGYGAMKDWLYKAEGPIEKITGYKPVVDKFGNPAHNTFRLTPQMGPFEFRLPINELNNAVAATTLTRINDELAAGVKITPEDMILRYLIFSHFDLLQDNLDISVGGLEEYKETLLSFWNTDPKTKGRTTQKASASVAKRLMAAMTPKMINEADKFFLDMQDRNMYSVAKEGFWEQLKKKIPLNTPFVRRYVAENDPETYKALPFTYEWTDWQMYLALQKEGGQKEGEDTGPPQGDSSEATKDSSEITRDDQFGVQTAKFNVNPAGRRTIKAPDGEARKIRSEAISPGKMKYKENGYFAVAKEFDKMLEQAIKASNIDQLLEQHDTEAANDLIRELAEEVKRDPEFRIFKKEHMEPKDMD